MDFSKSIGKFFGDFNNLKSIFFSLVYCKKPVYNMYDIQNMLNDHLLLLRLPVNSKHQ